MITNMKKFIIFSFIALTMSLFCASCIHKGDLELEPVPTIDFTLTKVEGYSYTLKNVTQGATNVSWAILSYETGSKVVVLQGSGDSFTFTFPKVGTYWIQMTATYNGREETIYTAKLIDKASVVKLDDDSFDDWNEVTRPDFQLRGRAINTPAESREGCIAFIDGKFDYDGDFVYFFVRVQPDYADAPMGPMDGGDDGNEFIIFINSDGDMTTTSDTQGDDGYEFLAEFNFWNGDGYSGFVDTSTGWDSLKESEKYEPAFKWGTSKEDGGYWCFEFGLDRVILGATKTAFGAQFQITSDWDTCDYLIDADGEVDMIFNLVSND